MQNVKGIKSQNSFMHKKLPTLYSMSQYYHIFRQFCVAMRIWFHNQEFVDIYTIVGNCAHDACERY